MAYRKKIISAGPLVKEIIYPYRSGGSSSNGAPGQARKRSAG